MAERESKESYGSDRAQLVYGRSTDGNLLHISEVQRGLACGCICPACDGQLVARTKADHKVPHFAHYSGEACGGGPETVIHLLAKEAFRSNPKMLLPERLGLDERKQVVMKPGQEVATEFLRLEYTDPKEIVPDLYVRALGYDLFVEVAVTHFCGDTKLQHLRDHRTPAVEIDLSKLPRDSTREVIVDAVLRSAPRHWLFHPGIEAAQAKFKKDEEAWRKEQDERQANAANKHRKRVGELARAYADGLKELAGAKGNVPRHAELVEVGLVDHVGIEVAGFACFTVLPAVWQAIILAEVFHDRCLGNGPCKAVPITKHLEQGHLIRPQFQRVSREVADDTALIETQFVPAWKAIDNYLNYLLGKGVLFQQGYGVALAKAFADPWTARTLAETKRTASLHATVQLVDWILSELPDDERCGMNGESWLQSIHQESGLSYREALQSNVESAKIVGQIENIAAMMEKNGRLPYGNVGLPIERAIERRRAQMAKHAEELREKQLQAAERLRHSRRDRLCVDAEKELTGPGLDAFLNTRLANMNNMTPLEMSEDSESGLTRAREALSELVRQRLIEAEAAAEREEYRRMITDDARQCLSEKDSESFLNGRDDDLNRTTPLLFVKDAETYRKARGKLTQWQDQFGGPF
ncbi:competence protein CoiA family protein [Mesorhizobium sp. LNHC209A00]|uniref:competence protein CoiA family protein n=1 Tax=Mesorhizobium TaxID=68287 RepID=UPI0003CFA093|nr:competence protein CoiA family protein [Mesorhizobium sp. LNHC209A00]ESZ01866.1 hypothetical protein X738_01705 [Mesorhizobium sp. LNHC209A00]